MTTVSATRMERLVAELREAEASVEAASESVSEAKAAVRERAELLRRRQQTVREIMDELIGKGTRPVLDAIAAKEDEETADERQRGPTGPTKVIDVLNLPRPKRARKGERADRKKKEPERWQDVALSEILPDDCGGADIIDKVAAHLELLEDRCPTVGDIALIWLSERDQPHTLEDLHSLTDAERETLRSTLAGFRIARGWEPRVAMPDGFPLAWLRPEPTADLVIDPMAAAKPAVVEEAPDGDAQAVAMCGLHPPAEWTSEDLERELERAITAPLGVKAEAWATYRKLGFITDVQIAEVLRSIWPRGHAFQAGEPKGKGRFAKVSPGFTIHGFPMPQFWVGARRHDTMRRPTLADRPLIDRVRGILGLPRATPAMLDAARAQVHAEDEAASKPARKRARKPGPAAVAP